MKLYLSIRDDDGNILMESLVLQSDMVSLDKTLFTEEAIQDVVKRAVDHGNSLEIKHEEK